MKKISSSLWKEIVSIRKDVNFWEACRTKLPCCHRWDPEPRDLSGGWLLSESQYVPFCPPCSLEATLHTRYDSKGQPNNAILFHCSRDANDIIIELEAHFCQGSQLLFVLHFGGALDEATRHKDYWNVMQESTQVLLIRQNTQGNGRNDETLQRGSFKKPRFLSEQDMRTMIEIYRDCCPGTLWIIEDMARFLHDQTNPKPVQIPSLCIP